MIYQNDSLELERKPESTWVHVNEGRRPDFTEAGFFSAFATFSVQSLRKPFGILSAPTLVLIVKTGILNCYSQVPIELRDPLCTGTD